MHPSKRKGDRHELATEHTLTELLAGTGLLVERTRAGYERDGGDLLILTPDRTVLFVIQCKDVAVNKWAFPEWLRDLARQCATSHSTRGFLSVKRPRVLDAANAYAVCDLTAMAALVRELWSLRQLSHEMISGTPASMSEVAPALPARDPDTAVPPDDPEPVDTPMSISRKSIMNGAGPDDGPDPDALQDPPGTVRGAVVYPWRRSEPDRVSP
jgi:hypothetical protein